MADCAPLLSELEQSIERHSLDWRAETLQRITALFVSGANQFGGNHIQVFELVIGRLLDGADAATRAALAEQLAPISNAPRPVLNRLARDPDVRVAEPILKSAAGLNDDDLMAVIESGSQDRRLAIAGRGGLSAAVAERLVTLGDRDVLNAVLDNPGPLPAAVFVILLKRARTDGVLTAKIGQRADIPADLLRELAIQAGDIARQLSICSDGRDEPSDRTRKARSTWSAEAAPPRTQASHAIREVFQTAHHSPPERAEGPSVAAFATTGRQEDIIASLSAQCAVPINVVDRLWRAERLDPILVLCKAGELSWPTVRAILELRPSSRRMTGDALDAACAYYERLSTASARRVLRFWQIQTDGSIST